MGTLPTTTSDEGATPKVKTTGDIKRETHLAAKEIPPFLTYLISLNKCAARLVQNFLLLLGCRGKKKRKRREEGEICDAAVGGGGGSQITQRDAS